MARCTGSKPDGTPCGRIVGASHTYCYAHDPHRQTERRHNASKAGKRKPNTKIRELKRQLEELANAVLGGTLERGDAAVVNQIIGTQVRLLEFERRPRELGEIEERLELLERSRDSRATRGI